MEARAEALEAKLRTSESRFDAVIAQDAPFMCEIDERGTVVYVGPRVAELIPPGALPTLGTDLRDFLLRGQVHPDDREGTAQALHHFVDRHEPVAAYRTRALDANGRWREFVASGAWYVDGDGHRRGVLIVREAPRPAQHASRARALESFVDRSFDAVIELDPGGGVRNGTQIPDPWAGAGEALTGRSVFDFVHPDDAPHLRLVLERALQGAAVEPALLRWRGAAGGWRALEARSVHYVSESNEPRVIMVATDLTGLPLAAAAVPAEEPNVAPPDNLALLASGVAHDFNNLLTIALGVSDLMGEQLSADSTARAYLDQVIAASRQAAALARQLLVVTGRGAARFSALDVNALIESMRPLLRAGVPKSIRLEFALAPEPLWIDGDPTQIRQVLLNLVTNAAEALGTTAGTIRVATRAETGAAGVGSSLVIEVSDDGPGIDEATQQRIFEPTFTTKRTGHGLGLAVVRGVARRHGGSVELDSAPGRGTTLRVVLPRLAQHMVEAGAALADVRERVLEAGRSVLLVDDDAGVRRVGAAMLGLAQVNVVEAESAVAARERLAADSSIACAVIDLTLGDGDGLALVEELRAIRPELHVVVYSGAVDRIPTDRPDLVVLEKPFSYAQLIDAVWRSLT
jgi:signal transduction histidine kinase